MSEPRDFIGDDARARQRTALLGALREGPITSIEARERLGIIHVAGRVMELRRLGHGIETHASSAFDAQGRKHSCARYLLSQNGGAAHD